MGPGLVGHLDRSPGEVFQFTIQMVSINSWELGPGKVWDSNREKLLSFTILFDSSGDPRNPNHYLTISCNEYSKNIYLNPQAGGARWIIKAWQFCVYVTFLGVVSSRIFETEEIKKGQRLKHMVLVHGIWDGCTTRWAISF